MIPVLNTTYICGFRSKKSKFLKSTIDLTSHFEIRYDHFVHSELTIPTVIINIIFGESQGQLWLQKVVISFMDAPYDDLFK